jgi:hypothetical protein
MALGQCDLEHERPDAIVVCAMASGGVDTPVYECAGMWTTGREKSLALGACVCLERFTPPSPEAQV